MVENIVDLPTELERVLFPDGNVLEECQVVIENRGHTQRVSRRVAYVSQTSGSGKTVDVDYIRSTSWIRTTDISHRITNGIWSRVVLATGDVSRTTRVSNRNVLWLATGVGGSARDLPVIKDRLHKTVVELAAQLGYIVDVINSQDMRLVEVGWRIVKILVWTTKENVR